MKKPPKKGEKEGLRVVHYHLLLFFSQFAMV
jgi:hypothetical protein